jgi:hypothetical protein
MPPIVQQGGPPRSDRDRAWSGRPGRPLPRGSGIAGRLPSRASREGSFPASRPGYHGRLDGEAPQALARPGARPMDQENGMAQSTERWRWIAGFENLYAVSSFGRVWSEHRGGRYLKPSTGKQALVVSLNRHGIRVQRSVHQLVAEAFIGPRPPGKEVCHWDDNYENNRLSNLRYGTRSDNAFDSVRNNRWFNTRKMKCKYGHSFTPDNTYVRSDGRRSCRTCHREEERERRRSG